MNFLDITLTIDSDRIATNIYHKPTDSHNYLRSSSSHPPSCKNSLPYAQLHRLRRICSDDADFAQESQHMLEFFHNRGYPNHITFSAAERVKTLSRDSALQPSAANDDLDRIFLVMTFHPVNTAVRNIIIKNYRILREHESTKDIFNNMPITSWRRDKNLSNHLVRAKDPQATSPGMIPCNRHRCKTCKYVLNTQSVVGSSGKTHKITSTFTCASRNLIYAIICQKCGHIYIGETKTPLSVRFFDHVRSIRDNLAGRPVAAHFN